MDFTYLGILVVLFLSIPIAFRWSLTKKSHTGMIYIDNKFACLAFAMAGFGVGSVFISTPYLAGEMSFTLVLLYTLLLWGSSVAIATDLYVQLIPHKITFPLALICVVLRAIDASIQGNMSLLEYAANFLLLPLVLFIIYYLLNKKTAGSAIGGGDVMLLTTIALSLGMFVFLVLLAFSIGALIYYGFHKIIRKNKMYPLGPSIYFGLVVFFWVYSLIA